MVGEEQRVHSLHVIYYLLNNTRNQMNLISGSYVKKESFEEQGKIYVRRETKTYDKTTNRTVVDIGWFVVDEESLSRNPSHNEVQKNSTMYEDLEIIYTKNFE